MIIACSGLSACYKSVPEELHNEINSRMEHQNNQPDLNTICENLKQEMLEINAQRTTLSLQEINQDIRLCLPLITFQEQQAFIHVASDMYDNFLKIDRSPEQQKAFYLYAHDQAQFPTIEQSQLEKLHPRDQYLLRHKGQAYIDLVDIDQHTFYRRNPYYLAKVFAPYFPEAERIFMQELAEQNQQSHFRAGVLNISAQEISRRALFWESYKNIYTNSFYIHDAQYLYDFYANLLFKNLFVENDAAARSDFTELSADIYTEIQLLASIENSQLAEQARLVLKFIDAEHMKDTGIITVSHPKSHVSAKQFKQELNRYLKLKPVDLSHPKDCFADAICH